MARRLTAEAVLEELELDDDFDASADEFDDIDDDVNFEDMSDDDDHSSEPSTPLHHPDSDDDEGSEAPDSDTPPSWSSTLKPVTIGSYGWYSGVVFITDLQDEMQSNLYAKEVMGEEKYSRWTQITREELQAYIGFCILEH